MYEEFYGFAQPPFSVTPDPRFLYRSESHDAALKQVWQTIRRKDRFMVLLGDPGSGKTTLCRTIVEQVDRSTFAALVSQPVVSVEELLREVLVSYGVASRDALNTSRLAGATKTELVRALHGFLTSLQPLNASAVLIVDEAEQLSAKVLEEIHALLNVETSEGPRLQVVLAGEPKLLDTLSSEPSLRPLNQQISARSVLRPLTREEVEAYITHRLWVARGSSAVSFSSTAVDIVYAASSGVPRIINLVCERALMIAAEERGTVINDTIVARAVEALGVKPQGHSTAGVRKARGGFAWKAALAFFVVIVAGVAATWNRWGDPFESVESAANPNVPSPPGNGLALRAVSLPGIPEQPLRLTSPSPSEGTFAVMIGTYTIAHEATKAEAALRARSLPLYALDMRFSSGIRRRLFVGRYATREQAEQVRSELATAFPNARVVTASSELWVWD